MIIGISLIICFGVLSLVAYVVAIIYRYASMLMLGIVFTLISFAFYFAIFSMQVYDGQIAEVVIDNRSMTVTTPGNYLMSYNTKYIVYWKEDTTNKQKAIALKSYLKTHKFKVGVHNDIPEYMRRNKW